MRRPLASLLALSSVLIGCEGRPRTAAPEAAVGRGPVEGPAVAEIDLSHGITESSGGGLFGAPSHRTHVELIRTLRALHGEATTKGVFVRIGELGLSSSLEIGHMLQAIKKQGLPVVCFANEITNATAALGALGCNRMWVSPAGAVDTVGLALQLVFAKSLLDKLRVTVDFEQVGSYKGAEEPFTRDAPSPDSRATIESTMRGLRKAWLDAVVEGRGARVGEVVEDGPYSPDDAKTAGIIDAVGYAEEARDEAKQLAHVGQVAVRFGGSEDAPAPSKGLVEVLRALSGGGHTGVPHVAVLAASGAIAMSSSGPLGFGDGGITEHDLGRQLARLTTDTATKAVVLRIDSPGGSALASDLLWKRMMKLRAEKPLVVSVGGMAASGGYYLSCAGTKVFADPTSIVGSIGVVGGKLSFGTSLEQIGVHVETIAGTSDPAKARRAAYMSPLAPWDDPTRERVRKSMQDVYELFLKRVAEGRGTNVDAIRPSAEGRIFAGTDAKERGLVDELGGLDEAIRAALGLAKLPDDTPIELITERASFFDLLEGGSGDDAQSAVEAAVAARSDNPIGTRVARWIPEVGTFVRAWEPALTGERAIAALPYLALLR